MERPQRDAKLARIEHVTNNVPQRVFAFDEFGPLVVRPQLVPAGRARRDHPNHPALIRHLYKYLR